MTKVSTTGIVVSLKTDLRFPVTGQQGHGRRIIHYVTKKTLRQMHLVIEPEFPRAQLKVLQTVKALILAS